MTVQIDITTTTVKLDMLDMPKPNKLNADPTARFIEISEKIKQSFGLLAQISTPFEFSNPEAINAPIINSNPLGADSISSFSFGEPLQKVSDEYEAAISQLVEQISSLNLHDSEFTIKSECSTKSPDKIASNAGNEIIKADAGDVDSSEKQDVHNECSNDGDTIFQILSLQMTSSELDCKNDDTEEVRVQENGTVAQEAANSQPFNIADNNHIDNKSISTIGADVDDSKEQDVPNVSTTDGNKHLQVPRLQNEELDCKNELDSNDDTQEVSVKIDGITDASNVADNKPIDNANIPIVGVDLDNSQEQDVHNVNGSSNSQVPKIQINCSDELDGKNDDTQEVQVQMDGRIEQNADNSQPSNVVDNNPIDNENVQTFSLQMNYEKEPDLVGSNKSYPISSVQLNFFDEQQVGSSVLLKDDDENIQMACSKTEDVDSNVTPNDNNNNSQTDACRSGDLDPDTQITHVDLGGYKQNPPPQKQFHYQPQPFEIEDVSKITWPNQKEVCFPPVMQLFGQTFSEVMVYGVVTSLIVEQDGLLLRFAVDDGSGSIDVVWKASRKVRELIITLHHLEEEVKRCRKFGLSTITEHWQPNTKECTEMLDNFDKILHFIKRQVTKQTKLKLFGHAAVVGKPFRSPRKDIRLYSELIEGISGGSSLELYFKKNLVRLYEEKYMPGS